MIINDKDVEMIQSLGLTAGQAKVYLALVGLGAANIHSISRSSDVSRQETYKIVSKLQNMGIVDRILTSPTTFKAIGIKQATSILLQQMKNKITEAQKNTEELLNKFEKTEIPTFQKDSQFVLISNRERILATSNSLFQKAQTEIKAVGPWYVYTQNIFKNLEKIKEALKRGAKSKIVISEPENQKVLEEIQLFSEKNPKVSLKYIQSTSPLTFLMIDNEEIMISIIGKPTSDERKDTILWSNNPVLLQLAQSYFEMIWAQARQ